MARGRSFATGLAVVMCVAPCAGATAAAARERSTQLEILGPSTRAVRFVVGQGETVVVARNISGKRARIELAFVTRTGDSRPVVAAVPGTSQPPVTADDPSDLRLPLAPGSSRRIELRFHLRPDQAPEDGSGALVAALASRRSAPAQVAIRGAPPDVAFDPPELTFDVSQLCWMIEPACGNTGAVLLRGRDAARWARRASTGGVAILNNGDGGSVTVHLRDFELRDGAVEATIEASDFREAGEYAGDVPLDVGGLAGPELAVQVKVRWSLTAAVLTIFAGALVGGFFLRRFEIRRRRKLLELELLSALGRYDEQRAGRPGKPASYDLDRLLEPRRHDQAATIPYPGTRGVSALLWHIKHARDDADFDEDLERTHVLVAAIERWLALEPVVRETAALLEDDAPTRRSGAILSETVAFRDLSYLRVRASTPPEDDAACEELIGALANQGRIAARCKILWELLAELESQDGILLDQAMTLSRLDVAEIESRYPSFEGRDPAQTDKLLVELQQAQDSLRRLHEDIGAHDRSSRVVVVRRIERRLDESARGLPIERTMPDVSPWKLRLQGSFNALALRSMAWTFARALVASVAYALVVYSDTWGSVTDFASAFTTGFLTETVVNWAVLPAFRSSRNRRRTKPAEQPSGAAETTGAPHSETTSAASPSPPDNGRGWQPTLAPDPPRAHRREP